MIDIMLSKTYIIDWLEQTACFFSETKAKKRRHNLLSWPINLEQASEIWNRGRRFRGFILGAIKKSTPKLQYRSVCKSA